MIERIELVSGAQGIFDVDLDSERVFSKHATGRHARPGEIAQAVRARLGPEVSS